MSKFKCKGCGNDEDFYRVAHTNYSFSDKAEMESSSEDGTEFVEWVGEVTCEHCYSDDIEEVADE